MPDTKLNIAFFNRSYHPDIEATGQYLTELTEDLTERGENVFVVCGQSYYVGRKRRWAPVQVSRHRAVRVVRVLNTRLAKSSFPFRLANLGTYFLGCVLALFLLPRPDVVVCLTDPPLLPLLAGVYARLTGARFVFAVNDLYPDVAVALGEVSNPFWLALLDAATSFGLHQADSVVVLGECMRERVLARGCPPARASVLPYWADADQIRPCKEDNAFRAEHGFGPSDFVIMYSGNLGLSQDLEDVLNVAARFRDREGLHFVIIGEGARKKGLQRMSAELGLDGNVRFLPHQPRARLAQSLGAADLHLVPLAEGAAGTIVPSKTYGIMASGTAYLAVMDEVAEPAQLAVRHGCGLWCPPRRPDRLTELIEYACENRETLRTMGGNGRRAVEQHFTRRAGTDRYHRLLRAVVSAGQAR